MQTRTYPQIVKDKSVIAWGAAGALAIVLSYVFTLVLALGCLALPVLVFLAISSGYQSLLFMQILLAIFGVVAGVSILWSLAPRREKFEPAGVPIDLTREPRLAAEIAAIAGALGQSIPTEVYLLPEANAFVAQRREGRGAKRKILALGLPLLQMLTIAEFRALLAHEFAHFYSGDTRLGPWVFQSRATMLRVYKNLGEDSEVLSFLTRYVVIAIPYMALMGGLRLYWRLFMRLTQLISRRQEFRSDEIACHVGGSDSLVSALHTINRCQAVYKPYWESVVFPVVSRGYQPQIADSFSRFLAAPHVAKNASDLLESQISNTDSKPYDTHPPLGARIANARKFASAEVADRTEADRQLAVSLVDHLEEWEWGLLCKLIPAVKTATLKPMRWETSGSEMYVPTWRREIAPFLPLLSEKTVISLPELVKDCKAIADKVPNPPGRLLNNRQRDEQALAILSKAFSLCLADNGWTVRADPASCTLERGTTTLITGAVLARLKSGALSAAEWRNFCASAAIGEWKLASTPLPQ